MSRDELGTGAAGYGMIASAFGIGMVLAPLVLLRRAEETNPASVLSLGIAMTAGGTLLTGLAPAAAIAVAAQGIAGAGNGLENVANNTLIQRTVPRHMLGRVFGVVYSGVYVAEGLAYTAGGPLMNLTSPRVVFVIGGCGVLLALLATWSMLPRRLPRASGIPT